jgi:hypothetical protein
MQTSSVAQACILTISRPELYFQAELESGMRGRAKWCATRIRLDDCVIIASPVDGTSSVVPVSTCGITFCSARCNIVIGFPATRNPVSPTGSYHSFIDRSRSRIDWKRSCSWHFSSPMFNTISVQKESHPCCSRDWGRAAACHMRPCICYAIYDTCVMPLPLRLASVLTYAGVGALGTG